MKARVEWTRELVERAMAAKGGEAHTVLADELGVTTNTIYGVKSRVNEFGGIEKFLARGTGFGPRGPLSLASALARSYVLKAGQSSGRGSQTQWTLTVPAILGEAFVEKFGRVVRYQPTEDGLLIVPVGNPVDLPPWVTENGDSP